MFSVARATPSTELVVGEAHAAAAELRKQQAAVLAVQERVQRLHLLRCGYEAGERISLAKIGAEAEDCARALAEAHQTLRRLGHFSMRVGGAA
jgi:hypothetical protein